MPLFKSLADNVFRLYHPNIIKDTANTEIQVNGMSRCTTFKNIACFAKVSKSVYKPLFRSMERLPDSFK